MTELLPVLTGTQVRLRPLAEADKAAYLATAGQAETVWGFGGSRADVRPRTSEEAERWLTGKPDSVRWGIEVEGRLIGTVQLHRIDGPNRRATLAIGIMSADEMNHGYGTETIRLVLRHGFGAMKLHRIDLRVLARNKRAIRAYEKCGFVREGLERDSARIDGAWEDDVLMAILESEYRPTERARR
jgi:RimJ/RimL family protein N-acetyltransferase